MKKKNKHFRSRRELISDLFFYGLLFVAGVIFLINILLQNENDLIKQWGEQTLDGSSGQRFAQAIEMFIINKFGKRGFFLFFLFIEIFLVTKCLVPSISAYRRFKKREREIREGLRAPDDYVDDYERVPLWRKIANLFTKKRKKKYPSERTMRDSLKKNKYYKE